MASARVGGAVAMVHLPATSGGALLAASGCASHCATGCARGHARALGRDPMAAPELAE
ncbi:MAG: hypothetical protein M3Z20_04960 [Chloroflexota bacterium]|nr:hypothetical protein [Chloroflexota bacterium]